MRKSFPVQKKKQNDHNNKKKTTYFSLFPSGMQIKVTRDLDKDTEWPPRSKELWESFSAQNASYVNKIP